MQQTVSRPMPSRRGYLGAAAIVLATIVLFVAFLFLTIADIASGMAHLTAPGQQEFPFARGSYTIFEETKDAGSPITAGDLRVEVTPAGGGEPVALLRDTSSNYSINGSSGRSLFTFVIMEPGQYRVSAAFPDGRSRTSVGLTISTEFIGKILKIVFAGLALMLIGFGAATVLAVLTFLRRRRAARA